MTLSDLIAKAREKIAVAAIASGAFPSDDRPLADGGIGAVAYADAITLYLAAALSRVVDYGSTLATWRPKDNAMRSSVPRQAFAMTWDFAEGNPFASSSSGWLDAVAVVASCLEGPAIPAIAPPPAMVRQADAATASIGGDVIISMDPPYYDNISYAELSDFFYVWLRRTLRSVFPSDTATMLVPKAEELVAAPSRHGGKLAAEAFFEGGIATTLERLGERTAPGYPVTIYYAFKQAETGSGETSSTGWEKFLEGVVRSGFLIDGTWPLRTEGDNRQNAVGANALASSIVLVCRRRPHDAPTVTRADFKRLLRVELPMALATFQHENIAPVDVAQASIGPGMAIFSRHGKVLESDGSSMSIRTALQLINEVLDEYLASGEGDFDADTRFAVTWFEQHGWSNGRFGDAETLAKARNVSVHGVVEAGVCHSGLNKVRILKRSELPKDYDPVKDDRPTIWEFTQHMIRRLEEEGEESAARLLKKLGSSADATRELAYRLYNTCERKKWAEDARSYNALILAWPELEKLAAKLGDEPDVTEPEKAGTGRRKKKAPKKGQQDLFGGDDE